MHGTPPPSSPTSPPEGRTLVEANPEGEPVAGLFFPTV